MVSPDPLQVDPALEELIHELARDPRSTLLRTERPARPARVTDSWEALSRWTPGLTAAEKELLDVHRAEFATLLIRRWLVENELRPPPRLFFVVGSSVKKPASTIDRSNLREESAKDHSEIGPEAKLAACLDPSVSLTPPQRSTIMATAVRLHPTTSTLLHHAQDLVRTGRASSSLKIVTRLLHMERRPVLRSYCWESLAVAQGPEWDPRDHQEFYRRASYVTDPRLDSLAWWMLVAAQNGDGSAVAGAAERIDDLYHATDSRVENHIRQQLRTRQEGQWRPVPGVRRLYDQLHSRLAATSKRILHVLL